MNGKEVYEAFKSIGAKQLHHANTVTTSCSFLQLGGLGSRQFVEASGLPQTSQESDDIDKKFGLWNCIFVDHVDIHNRGGRAKGPNQYGPVLFVFDLELLLELPAKSRVRVTKKNPWYFKSGETAKDHWFQSPDEVVANVKFGNFEKMVVIETPSGLLEFPNKRVRITLDAPDRALPSGIDARASADAKLRKSAKKGGVSITIDPANCRSSCICREVYAGYSQRDFDKLFG